jgi:hypothetical protein
MRENAFNQSAVFQKAYLENVDKALRCGGLDPSTEYNHGTLKAILLITAESFCDKKHKESQKNLQEFAAFYLVSLNGFCPVRFGA